MNKQETGTTESSNKADAVKRLPRKKKKQVGKASKSESRGGSSGGKAGSRGGSAG